MAQDTAPTSASSPLGSWNTVLVVVLVVVIGIVVVVFSVASPPVTKHTAMPQLMGKGLQYAVADARDKDWKRVETYDALGRNRSIRDQREWMVCFQSPTAGAAPGTTDTKGPKAYVSLGAVQTSERCPAKDYGELPQVYSLPGSPGTNTVPNLYEFTPFMARKAFGDDASIRVLRMPVAKSKSGGSISVKLFGDRNTNDDEIGGNQGDWLICRQDLPAGSSWDGRVLTTWVVPVSDRHC